jgi:hypothetical protein
MLFSSECSTVIRGAPRPSQVCCWRSQVLYYTTRPIAWAAGSVKFSVGGYEVLSDISNNSSFRLKHPCVPDGSDGSGRTLYPLTGNQTRPVAQATGRVAYLPCGSNYTMPLILATRRVVYYARRSGIRLPLLCVRNVVTYTHHQNDTYVTLFAGVAVMQ